MNKIRGHISYAIDGENIPLVLDDAISLNDGKIDTRKTADTVFFAIESIHNGSHDLISDITLYSENNIKIGHAENLYTDMEFFTDKIDDNFMNSNKN